VETVIKLRTLKAETFSDE